MPHPVVEQISFLLSEARAGSITVPELMKLIDVAYKDYLEFHPEEVPLYKPRRNVVERRDTVSKD